MISNKRCRELLDANKDKKKYSDLEIKLIKEKLYQLAQIEYEIFRHRKI